MPARKLLATLALALAACAVTAAPASAVTCAGLQAALDSATPGSTVTLDQGAQCSSHYDLPPDPITLTGGGTGATLSGDGETQILSGSDVGATTISNLTFLDGRADAGSGFSGSAIAVDGESPITVARSTFLGNLAQSDGGAVSVDSSSTDPIVISDSTFGSVEDGNSAGNAGGGAWLRGGGPIQVLRSTFTGNSSGGDGGGAALSGCGTITVTGSTFSRNELSPTQESPGELEGAGLLVAPVAGCRADLRRSFGPGSPDVTQSGNTFVNNRIANGQSGSEGYGAGEYAEGFHSMESTGDTFQGNWVDSYGEGSGASFWPAAGGAVTARNVVAVANALGTGYGGGIYFGTTHGSTLTIAHGTVVSNHGGEVDGVGIAGGSADTLHLHNSIVYGNDISGFDGLIAPLARAAADQLEVSHSDACRPGTTNAYAGEGNVCADPKLADPVKGDVHQTSASPTLDAGSAALVAGLTSDYEGDGRQLDADGDGTAQPDMGADELPAKPAPQATPAPTRSPTAAPSGGVAGTSAEKCVSRRAFRIKLRNRGQKVRTATVYVNGKKVRVLRGKRLTSRVDLRGLPKGRVAVRIVLKLAGGRTVSGTRHYHTCVPPRAGGVPKV
ncbi:MAG: hypothetical protein QOE28_2259 [Solirubrobacteraceae bacterium]|jgi:hypothetical protein|nr:hypothetical protein [Solirubrobacteraceae bacterium]